MKLFSRFIFCCLTLSTTCYASEELQSNGWRNSFRNLIGLKTLETLPKNKSFDCEWPADELQARKQTPSPDIVCIGSQGEEQPTPPTILQAARKMSGELQTDIMIAAATLPTVTQKSAAGLNYSTTSHTLQSDSSSYDEGIDRLAATTNAHHLQPNPMHDTQSSSYQNSQTTPRPLDIDRDSSENMITQPTTSQPSIVSMIMVGCCPCFPCFDPNNEDSKKKSKR